MLDSRQQFRVLYRDFLMRMVDVEVLAAGGDVQRLLGQFGALLAAFSFVVAIYIIPPYVATTLRPDQVALAAWGDQEFLISTTMAVVGIFAVIAWDAVFPDRRDCLILGMLPVATRTIFRAKVAALSTALAVSVVAVNVATGISYSFVSLAWQGGALGIARAFFAYWAVMTLAGLFMFCSLLALQGLAAQLLSYRLFLRASNVLQLGAFFLILGVYFLTPGPTDMSLSDPGNQRLIAWLPSFWFLAVFQRLNGVVSPVFAPLAARGLWGLLAAVTVAVASYALAYYRNIRRIIEQPDISPRDRARQGSELIRLAAQRLLSTPLERALLLFVARTIGRSRQHRVILAAFGGIGLAIALTFARSLLYGDLQMTAMAHRFGFTPPLWYEPNVPFMAAGFVMLFFAVIGTRAVFSLPANLKANWIFRMTAVHSPRAYFAATRKSVFWLAAAPVWIVAAILYLSIWPRVPAFAHVAVMILVGIILIERSLIEFRKVPFACSYLPGKSDMRLKLGGHGLGLIFAVYLGASIENSMLETIARASLLFAVLVAFTVHARRSWVEFAASPVARLQFEDVEIAEVSPLNLHDGAAYSNEERYIDILSAPPEPAKVFARKTAIAAVVLIAIGVTYEQVSERLHPRPPQIGRSYDIGGRSLNMFCSGQGSPSVVFESGAGGPGYAWVYVQGEVAKFARACWYDRAGYGWSDSAPYPRDSAAIAEDLHRLLHTAQVPPPYVLVGASFGGLNVRVYNRQFPAEVAGMVLVDSSHDDEQQTITPIGGGWLPYFPHAMSILTRALKEIGVLRLVMDGPERNYIPKGLTPNQYRLIGSFEPRTMAENGKELFYESRLEARAAGGLGDRPLVVLTAGLPPPSDSLGDARQRRRNQEEWIKIQGQLTRLSTRGKQIVVPDSHHAIQFDRPDAVIDAIHEVVADVRGDHLVRVSLEREVRR